MIIDIIYTGVNKLNLCCASLDYAESWYRYETLTDHSTCKNIS